MQKDCDKSKSWKKCLGSKDMLTKVCLLLYFVGVFCFFQFKYQYHFFFKEQQQLFLMSWDYMADYHKSPAWLSCLVGDFLTQFNYYLYVGAAILTVSLAVMGDLTRRIVEKVTPQYPLPYVVAIVATTLEAWLHLDATFGLPSTVSIIGAEALTLLYYYTSRLRPATWMPLTAVAILPLCYWLFGYGWMVMAIAVLLMGDKRKWQDWAVRGAAVAVGSVFAAVAANSYDMKRDDALLYPGVGHFKKPEWDLEELLAIENEYQWGHYGEVLELTTNAENKSDIVGFYFNLANAQLGMLPDKILEMQPIVLGTDWNIGPETPLMSIYQMHELYFALGDMTFTERAAMMAMVFSVKNRNGRIVTRLAEANMINGDTAAATKYSRLLEKTITRRNWLSKMRQNVIDTKKEMVNTQDTIRTSDHYHAILTELLESNIENTMALDYLLCTDLMLYNVEMFKYDYDRWCMQTGKQRIKDIYQQALMIWLSASGSDDETWHKYIASGEMVNQFKQYLGVRGNKEAMKQFRNTYWYYFDSKPTEEKQEK